MAAASDMDVFAAATDAVFADPNIACAALWRAAADGQGVPVRIVMRRPDRIVGFGDSRAISATTLIDVRKSDIANPALGDAVSVGADAFELIAAPVLDSLGLVWTCEAALKA